MEKFPIDVKCAWYEPIPFIEVDLRRLSRGIGNNHVAWTRLGVFPWSLKQYGHLVMGEKSLGKLGVPANDVKWPTRCTRHEACDYVFKDEDDRLVDITRQYRSDTNAVVTSVDFPLGAMSWHPSAVGTMCGNDTLEEADVNEDGRCIFVVIPARPAPYDPNNTPRTVWWAIDSLTAGDDVRHGTKLIGKSWKRIGQPPDITVLGDLQSYLGFVGTVVDGRLRGHLLEEGPEEPEEVASSDEG